MKLNELKPNAGAKKAARRIGRGPGSGWGKTSARGSKGQNSRSGSKTPPWFEGGQMPLQRRMPKRGFTNPFHKEFAVVNCGQLAKLFKAGETVDEAALIQAGVVKDLKSGVKLLGDGEISAKLTVKVTKASKNAVAKIEAAGGTIEVS